MEKLITYQEVAMQLDLSTRYIAKLVALKKIPYVKFGKSVRFSPIKIQEWVDKKGNAQSASLVSIKSKLTIVKVNKGVA
jgi:excisionase family DNA binding protein